ncbi:MAG: filamentous hemagglutinin N-terminal domain-containing protein, partial [Nitrospira sp.]|nr:filamentous hemagglutinin N-terminal domain-containing protein [Nitrospira sp.]
MSELMQTMRSNQKTVEKKRERARHISQGSLLLVGGMLWVVSGGWVQAEPSPAPTQLPTGGQVVGGQASISQQSAVMTIQQQTNRAAIDWQSFDIGSQARVTFQQPSLNSVALNRVQGGNPSQIFGQLQANGQVFLSNPHGIVFGPSAHVEVGGLVATTHSLSLEDFMAGRDRFTREGATGTVVNEGELKAALGGYIALLAPEVRNEGVIVADMGTVALAAGEAYELHFDQGRQLTTLIVEPATIETLVDNQQAILAPGGLIILSAHAADQLQGSVVKNDGIVNANSLVTRGGRIVLEGENLTQQGILTAAGDTDGGEITLAARDIAYVDGLVDVSGTKATGGTITVQAGKLEGMKSATFRANGEQGGVIHLEGQGTVGLSSTVN